MKTKNLLNILIGCIVVSALSVSCAKEIIDKQYVKLDLAACSFYSSGNEPIEISIVSNPADWKAESDASWLTVDRNDDGSMLILTATDNDSEYERSAAVTVTAGEAIQKVTVYQLGFNADFYRYRKLRTFQMGAVVSPSGKYVGGFEASIAEDDSFIFHPVIVDTQTGQEYRNVEIPQSLYDLYQPMAISDEGLLFIHDGYTGIVVAFDLDGNYFPVEADGYRNNPMVQGTSADGRMWVGYAQKETDASWRGFLETPLVWIDGEIHELQFPEKNYRDEDFWVGIMARGISADGSIIYGTTWDNMDFGMVYWDDINAPAKYVGEDVRKVTPVKMVDGTGAEYDSHIVNGIQCTANLLKVSPSGKWIAGTYCTETLSEDRKQMQQMKTAAFYNTETGETTIVEDYGESTGMRATDDGIAFIGIGTFGVGTSVVYNLNTKSPMGTLQEWISDNYGIDVPATGTVTFINEDKTVIFGNYPEGTEFNKCYYIAPPIAE